MADFMDLLHDAEKLTTDIAGTSELPKVDRSLPQVLEASRELFTKVAQTGSTDIQANLLLGSRGVDLPKIVQKLEAISAAQTFEPVQHVDDYDISTCLENEIRNCILGVIDEEHQRCFDSINQDCWEHLCGEWKQEKRKILNAMIAPSNAFIEVDKKKSVFIEKAPAPSPGLGPEEAVYASKVYEFNNYSSKAVQKPNLVHVFAKAAEEFKDNKVNDMWEIMKYMVDIPSFPSSDNPLKIRDSDPVIKALVHQAKRYLEDRYKTYMATVINDNLSQAMRGGVPGTYHLVRGYVGVRLQGDYLGLQDGSIEGRPIWPMVYYCIRSGDTSAALHCLKQSNCSDCQDLVALLEMKFKTPENPELLKLEANIRFQYRRFVRNSTDPFKRIVWCVMGCCDTIDQHTEVARTADDYLWLKLSLVRVDYDKDDYVKYSDLQKTIIDEYGEAHYDAVNQPHLYFQVLALTAQFEAALEFLTRIERYKVHGVHMAIALNELYMLACPRDVAAPLICIDPLDPKPARRLNIARLIMIYVRKFEVICLSESVQYFFLLRSLRDSDGCNLFTVCVSDLAIETREYHRLLGKIERNGLRTRGIIDSISNSSITVEEIAKRTGETLKKKGNLEDAITLFDLAGEEEEVITLLCDLLSQVVNLPSQPGSLRERLQVRTQEIFDRYSREGRRHFSSIFTSFSVLKDLLVFFDYYHSKQYSLALKILEGIRLVPLNSSDLEERFGSFKNLNAGVRKVIPDVLLATMNMLFDQYQKMKNAEYVPRSYQESSANKQLEHIRGQAKTLTSFAGMLPYRMPGDTNSKLVQMEILMH